MAESHASPSVARQEAGRLFGTQRTNMPTSFWPNKVGQSTCKGLQKGTHNRHWTAFRPLQQWAGRTGDRSQTPPERSSKGKGKGSGATSSSMALAGSDTEAEDPQPRHQIQNMDIHLQEIHLQGHDHLLLTGWDLLINHNSVLSPRRCPRSY